MRMGGSLPKQFLLLKGKSILQRSVEAFESHTGVQEIVVVSPPNYVHETEELLKRARVTKVSHVVAGGRERQHSVRNGLLSLRREPDIVLVHDAVRPLVTSAMITHVIRAAQKYGAAVVGVRVSDTVKIEEEGFYKKTLDRSKIWVVQTPQGFQFDILKRAHFAALRNGFLGTDDASLVERLKIHARIVEGDYRNIKITSDIDLNVAEMLLKCWLK